VKGLGPDNIIDYTDNDAQNQLEHYGKYVNIIVKIEIIKIKELNLSYARILFGNNIT